jgi:hypothetical protein
MANRGMWSGKNLRKKAFQAYEMLSASYHEAGHTIYGLLEFIKIGSVSVNLSQKGAGNGITFYETVLDEEDVQDSSLFNYLILSEVKLSYSGFCSEKIFFKAISGTTENRIFLRDGSSDDVASAAALISKYNLAPAGKKRYQYKQKLKNDITKTLNKHWDDVVIVSHALFQRKKLYYSDLKSLLLKKSPNKSYWKAQFKQIDYLFDNRGLLDTKELKSIVLR